MKAKQIYYTYLLTTILFVGCATQRTGTIVSCNYDSKKNQTDYMVFPYGSVSISGKWDKTNYNSPAKQQFFKNEEGVTIAIAFGSCNNFEFNADKSKKGFDFVRAYYVWDSKYFEDNGLQQDLLEEDETNNFVLWRVYGNHNDSNINTYFLFGEKKGVVNSFSITTDKWTTEQKIEFLKGLYNDKK